MWGELSSEWGELSSECGASCLGASFLWGELSWGELSLGRVVRNSSKCPQLLSASFGSVFIIFETSHLQAANCILQLSKSCENFITWHFKYFSFKDVKLKV